MKIKTNAIYFIVPVLFFGLFSCTNDKVSLKINVDRASYIYINGKYVGQTVLDTLITRGEHELKVVSSNDSNQIYVKKLNLAEVDSKDFQIILDPIQELIENMVLVEGGSFMIGCSESFVECDSDEKPAQKVTLDSFYINKYELTVRQFAAFVRRTGYITAAEEIDSSYVYDQKWYPEKGVNWRHDVKGILRPLSDYDHPVLHLKWQDAADFYQWLSELTNKKYTFPTEAQWEFAAKGGNKSKNYKFSGADELLDIAWMAGNSGTETHPVGQKPPNELGLYDMSGNVWEWCKDWYSNKYQIFNSNPSGPPTGAQRVLRGGSWDNWEIHCRNINRFAMNPDYSNANFGYRVAMNPSLD